MSPYCIINITMQPLSNYHKSVLTFESSYDSMQLKGIFPSRVYTGWPESGLATENEQLGAHARLSPFTSLGANGLGCAQNSHRGERRVSHMHGQFPAQTQASENATWEYPFKLSSITHGLLVYTCIVWIAIYRAQNYSMSFVLMLGTFQSLSCSASASLPPGPTSQSSCVGWHSSVRVNCLVSLQCVQQKRQH